MSIIVNIVQYTPELSVFIGEKWFCFYDSLRTKKSDFISILRNFQFFFCKLMIKALSVNPGTKIQNAGPSPSAFSEKKIQSEALNQFVYISVLFSGNFLPLTVQKFFRCLSFFQKFHELLFLIFYWSHFLQNVLQFFVEFQLEFLFLFPSSKNLSHMQNVLFRGSWYFSLKTV